MLHRGKTVGSVRFGLAPMGLLGFSARTENTYLATIKRLARFMVTSEILGCIVFRLSDARFVCGVQGSIEVCRGPWNHD